MATSISSGILRARSRQGLFKLKADTTHLFARCFSSSYIAREEAYILSASRTPTGTFNGSFTTVSATELGSIAIGSAVLKSNVPKENISEVYMGQVLQANCGQAPARQAAILAGLPVEVEATTINKVCASAMKAVSLAAQTIQLGQSHAIVAGGMENMTRTPYVLPRSSQLPSFGHTKLIDNLISDGLWDVYNQFHMGSCVENTVKKFNISRKEQDEYAIESYARAKNAYQSGLFAKEIVPVTVRKRGKETVVSEDEQYTKLDVGKLGKLKPVFETSGDGTITAGNSSPLSDGASAVVIGSTETASKYGKQSEVLARIVAYGDAAVEPIDFSIAPAKVVPLILSKAGLSKQDIAIWEFNEAFAAVIKANEKLLGLEQANVNPLGGAIALGHALGSSGTRILTTLLYQLKIGEYGLAAICNGGGASTGIIVQRIAYEDI